MSSSLSARRAKLGKLLAMERRCLEAELAATCVPIDPLEVLENRAADLRRAKETERLRFVAEKNAQRLRLQNPEFRKMEGKISAKLTQQALQAQMQEKRRAEEEAKQENEIFEALTQQQYLAQIAREEQEWRAGLLRNEETRKMLDYQTDLRRRAREEEQRKKLDLPDMTFTPVTARKRQAALVPPVAVDKKKLDRREEKLIEAIAIAEIVRKEREQVALEIQRKREKAAELLAFAAGHQEAKEEQQKFEKNLDLALQTEADLHWNKRCLQWKLEEQARQALMQQVYAERALQVQEKEDRMNKMKAEVEKKTTVPVSLPPATRKKHAEYRAALDKQVAEREEKSRLNNIAELEAARKLQESLDAELALLSS